MPPTRVLPIVGLDVGAIGRILLNTNFYPIKEAYHLLLIPQIGIFHASLLFIVKVT